MFNPHANHTSDGVLITVGLKVLDYNRRETTVVEDRDCQDWKCCADEASGLSSDDGARIQHTRRNDLVRDTNGQSGTCSPGCSHDHWYTMENGAMMNGSRLQSRR